MSRTSALEYVMTMLSNVPPSTGVSVISLVVLGSSVPIMCSVVTARRVGWVSRSSPSKQKRLPVPVSSHSILIVLTHLGGHFAGRHRPAVWT